MKDGTLTNLLSPEATRTLERLITPYHYQSATQLFYEGQTPIVAYLVLEGQINLIKNRKVKYVVRAGEILGLPELLSHDSIPFSAEVMPKTKVLFIDRSTVKEILNERDDQLKRSFATILETA